MPQLSRTAADDRDAIRNVLGLYCRAMDRMDRELGYTIWHEDGEADYGEGIFTGSGRGFIDFVTPTHAGMANHSHQITTTIIDLDGDRAASETYVIAALRIIEGGQMQEVTTRGRYLDRWSFRGGRWAIDRRVYLHDFADVRPVTDTPIPTRGTRDRSDLSYTVLGSAMEPAKAGA